MSPVLAFLLGFLGNGVFLVWCRALRMRRSGQTLTVGVPHWQYVSFATVVTWWAIRLVTAGGGRPGTLRPLMAGWLMAVVGFALWSWRRAIREGVAGGWADPPVRLPHWWRAVAALVSGVILIPLGVLAIGVGAQEFGAWALVAGVMALARAIRNLNRWVDE